VKNETLELEVVISLVFDHNIRIYLYNPLCNFHRPAPYFMLSLLENPNLLEHDSFTDLLLAIFHLSEELAARDTLVGLPQSDYEHLAGDIKACLHAANS